MSYRNSLMFGVGKCPLWVPRPHTVAHNEQYRALIQGYMLRHKVKLGITGLAQINGWRGETDTLEKWKSVLNTIYCISEVGAFG